MTKKKFTGWLFLNSQVKICQENIMDGLKLTFACFTQDGYKNDVPTTVNKKWHGYVAWNIIAAWNLLK